MRSRRVWWPQPRRATVVATAVIAGLVLAGCGVSSQAEPVRVGDGLAAGIGGGSKAPLPLPHLASDPATLVRLFFKASAGGGPEAVSTSGSFLTADAKQSWRPGDARHLTVVRLLSVTPELATGGRTPVTVEYQTVGVLGEQGNIDELSDAPPARMTFDVLRGEQNTSQLQIDHIVGGPGGGLWLSDDALDDTYYQAHPIYFWDTTGQWLVPDVRYLPLTIDPEQRPNLLLQWLVEGPAPWLRSVVGLPAGSTSKAGVVNREGKFVVNLSAEAEAGGDAALRKLVYQLRWSLPRTSTFPEIELQIEGQTRNVGSTADVERFDAAAELAVAAHRFAIVGGKVVQRPPSGASPAPIPILDDAQVNRSVVAAAVSRDLKLAAFVRSEPNGTLSLYVRRNGEADSTLRVLRNADSMTRPVVVPGTDGRLLIVSDGRLYAIDAKGVPKNITPTGVIGQVTAVALPPDARRIAFIAGGKAYVAALINDEEGRFSIGGQRRSILANQVPAAIAVAWTSETNLLVAGTNGDNRPSLWQVTADGVAADDVSGPFGNGLRPVDLVAHPESPILAGLGETTVMTNRGAGRLFTPFDIEANLDDPFYAG
jgi:Sporulation and spore germination